MPSAASHNSGHATSQAAAHSGGRDTLAAVMKTKFLSLSTYAILNNSHLVSSKSLFLCALAVQILIGYVARVPRHRESGSDGTDM
jgi:hypothetical protein